uniref:C2H2-type domain-containing protein n=1 Tax=Hippocampus comes TaxID=109280 RepID=A0A3Q2YJV3_HIPCM
MTEEEQQQQDIGCLINSDGEEVDLSDLRKSITPSLVGSLSFCCWHVGYDSLKLILLTLNIAISKIKLFCVKKKKKNQGLESSKFKRCLTLKMVQHPALEDLLNTFPTSLISETYFYDDSQNLSCSTKQKKKRSVNVLLSFHAGETASSGSVATEPPSTTFSQSENEKPASFHTCSVCGKDFPYASKLQRHLRTHSGERPFPCSMCNKRFPEKGLLMIHERVHTGEKPYPCTFCEKRFASQGELRLHRRTHTGERPYHCSICLKSFSRHWHLKTHLDRTHTGERPYQCSFCDKRFALSGTLVRHERLHTGITPYHCLDCGKTFAQQWTLTTHMRTHRGEKPYSCTQCDKSFVAPGELRSDSFLCLSSGAQISQTFPILQAAAAKKLNPVFV